MRWQISSEGVANRRRISSPVHLADYSPKATPTNIPQFLPCSPMSAQRCQARITRIPVRLKVISWIALRIGQLTNRGARTVHLPSVDVTVISAPADN